MPAHCTAPTDTTALRFRGRDWEPQSFANCMASDAFRIALGGKPQYFTLREIVVWLTVRAPAAASLTSQSSGRQETA